MKGATNSGHFPQPSRHFVAGTTAGLVSTALLYPLDLIKVRYQVNELSTLKAPQRLRGAFIAVVRNEGWRGLYQGLPAAMYGSGLSWGGDFFFYEHAKTRWLMGDLSGVAGSGGEAWRHLMAACEAGTIMVGLTNPIWLIKTRMQLQFRRDEAIYDPIKVAEGSKSWPPVPRPYKGFADALVTIVREEGVLALYKGCIPALLLVSHGAVQFVVYEWLKTEVPHMLKRRRGGPFPVIEEGGEVTAPTEAAGVDSQQQRPHYQQRRDYTTQPLSSLHFLAMGAVAKVVASVATYPFQVIKTRLQQRKVHLTDDDSAVGRGMRPRPKPPLSGNVANAPARPDMREVHGARGRWTADRAFHGTKMQYLGVVDCATKTWAREGAYGFYKGCFPNAVRVAPGAAITFAVYEAITDFLGEW